VTITAIQKAEEAIDGHRPLDLASIVFSVAIIMSVREQSTFPRDRSLARVASDQHRSLRNPHQPENPELVGTPGLNHTEQITWAILR
jgi:hypothetical protein